MNRREFLEATTGAAAAMLLLKPETAFGYEANSAIRHALLGCGGRGTAVAESFARNTAARVVALGDIFADKLAAGRNHFEKVNASLDQPPIAEKLLFHGQHAFEQLATSPDVDLIQISTPPRFHVQHLGAAVAGGKHVYCEKPVGIDVKQAKEALEIAKKVKPTQSVDVGFQCRCAPPFAAIAERIRNGALGKMGSATGYYFAPQAKVEPVPPSTPAEQEKLRRWYWYRSLSGDILVEQNIHIIDLFNWLLGARPLKATATGGRTILDHAGDCWDNYQVELTYPDNVHLAFSSTQFGNYGIFDAGLRLFGSGGAAAVPYAGPVQIVGAQSWAWDKSTGAAAGAGKFAANGAFQDNLEFADREKERDFIASITSGKSHNQIAAGVETALSCMLGRMAGLTGRETTWDELLAHGETYALGMNIENFA